MSHSRPLLVVCLTTLACFVQVLPSTALLQGATLLPSTTAHHGSTPPPPVWGPHFQVPINQTITYLGVVHNFQTMMYYDTTTKPYGSSLYVHGKGQFDELCRDVKPLSDEPCNLLASPNGWRYVFFPGSKYCCRACNATHGCGIISPDWLVHNSSYVGQRTINGHTCDGWEKTGSEQNFYFATADADRKPCEYYEGYPTFNVGKNEWLYNTSAYNPGPVDPAVFDLPTWATTCTLMCPNM